ncbi:ATP-dependent DNA helicase PcrA [Anatilimnocola aggregata]|uniref:DNA 3'-5' helicase n=1 Tax=Anatilimnocola aggregata TaxID=2528021 RepID=A0A517YDW7_9BACT|nr:UvrD-helicase domain-containing protein [Anatilimnocola aggregata]QDU28426.1 ATP-dependent DNA helicase PcrA [Anatilimnocola aggregata]
MSNGLNQPQQDAVNTLRGPLLVLAGAGSGKTRVVTFRIANLIKHGIVPSRILAVTFTNKAAAEMQERIAGLLGKQKDKPLISTFHSQCVKVLKRHITKLGYPPRFTIYDRGDQESLARQVLREIRVSDEMMRPGDLINQISRWKTLSLHPAATAQVAQTDKEHLASMGYRKYQRALKNFGAVDFDDLLLCTEELFEKHNDVRLAEAGLFDHVLVDEYQDTNGSQYRIIKALARDHRNLCVVGDDDQSIYGWRGAEVKHILQFGKDWPDAKTVRLEYNYRSTAAILDAANKLIVFNKHRHDKILRAARPGGEKPRILQYNSEVDEAREVVADIARVIRTEGREAKDFAILFRTNEQPRPFETELRKAKLPYVVLGSQSFFDRKEVKDLLSLLRTIESPRDEQAMLRIINTPPRGIGAKTVEGVIAAAVKSGKTAWDVMSGPQLNTICTGATADKVLRFVDMLKKYRAHAEMITKAGKQRRPAALAELLRQLVSEIGYEAELNRLYPDPNERQNRLASIEEVVNAVAQYEQGKSEVSLGDFLDEVTLGEREFGDTKDKQLSRNAIALLTMHASKGLEYPHVYIVGLEEGILPHHRTLKAESGDDIDEERRLCYVGITRAEEKLTLSLALTRMKWGKPRDTQPSRFLFEIIGQAENPRAKGKR